VRSVILNISLKASTIFLKSEVSGVR